MLKEYLPTIFGYYFAAIFGFSILSGVIYFVYFGLVSDYLSAKYPDEYKKMFSSYLWSPTRVREIFRRLLNFNDDKLNGLAAKGLFWLNSCISIVITAPLGMIAYIILMLFF